MRAQAAPTPLLGALRDCGAFVADRLGSALAPAHADPAPRTLRIPLDAAALDRAVSCVSQRGALLRELVDQLNSANASEGAHYAAVVSLLALLRGPELTAFDDALTRGLSVVPGVPSNFSVHLRAEASPTEAVLVVDASPDHPFPAVACKYPDHARALAPPLLAMFADPAWRSAFQSAQARLAERLEVFALQGTRAPLEAEVSENFWYRGVPLALTHVPEPAQPWRFRPPWKEAPVPERVALDFPYDGDTLRALPVFGRELWSQEDVLADAWAKACSDRRAPLSQHLLHLAASVQGGKARWTLRSAGTGILSELLSRDPCIAAAGGIVDMERYMRSDDPQGDVVRMWLGVIAPDPSPSPTAPGDREAPES